MASEKAAGRQPQEEGGGARHIERADPPELRMLPDVPGEQCGRHEKREATPRPEPRHAEGDELGEGHARRRRAPAWASLEGDQEPHGEEAPVYRRPLQDRHDEVERAAGERAAHRRRQDDAGGQPEQPGNDREALPDALALKRDAQQIHGSRGR